MRDRNRRHAKKTTVADGQICRTFLIKYEYHIVETFKPKFYWKKIMYVYKISIEFFF